MATGIVLAEELAVIVVTLDEKLLRSFPGALGNLED
jgi:predicted nucleic acid-binding protein